MAVNLRATATLNTKPFIAGIKSIKAATESLNKSVIKGSKEVISTAHAEKAAREATSKVVRQNQQAVTKGTGTVTKALDQAVTKTDAYKKSLSEVQGQARKIIDSYAQMTPAMARHSKAVMDLSRAEVALATQQAEGLKGPALQRYQTAVDNAARAVGRARASIIADNEKVAASTKKAADAQVARNAATTKGIADAKAYTQGLSGLSQEKLKLQAASERLSGAEARLASAMARSNGVITPAVSQARAGVISATAAYNSLAEAQTNVGKAGTQIASGLAAQRYLYHDLSRQAAGLALGLAAIPAAAITVGAVWENQFANVIRTSDDSLRTAPKRLDALRTSLVGMAKDMPTSFRNITEIATLGNQMGVAASELEGFTRAVGMFSATSGIAVEEAATAFGRLRTVASDANFSYMGVADSILRVGVNSVATEQEIINVTTQISSIAASAGFSTQEMIGLSGALASVRVPPELSRSIITRTFGQFDKAIQKNGTELQTLARVSGRSVEDIKKNWGAPGAADIFTDFISGIRAAGGQARSELEALGITSVRDVPALMRLANAADSNGVKGGLLTQTITDAKTAAGTVQEQYSIMASTVAGKLKILGNNVLSMFDAMGNSSNVAVKGMIDGLTKFVNLLEDISDNPFSGYVLGATAAVAAGTLLVSGMLKIVAAGKAVQHAMTLTKGSTFMAAIGGTGKAGGAGALAALSPMMAATAVSINNMRSGLVAAGGAWRNFGGAVSVAAGAATSALGSTTRGTTMMATGMKNLYAPTSAATGALGNLVKYGLHPVTIGLAAVGTIGVLAYKEWSKGFHTATTTTENLAKALSEVDAANINDFNRAIGSINISGNDMWQPWVSGVKPFQAGLPGLVKDMQTYVEWRENMVKADISSHDMYSSADANATAKAKGLENPEAFSKGLARLDEAFGSMRSAGNEAQVLAFWKQLGSTVDNSTERAKLFSDMQKKMPKEAEAIATSAALAGVSTTKYMQDLNKYAGQALDTLMGFEGTSVIGDALNLDPEEAAAFGKALNEAASAFIDFGSAIESATTLDDKGVFQDFNLDKFDASLRANIDAQNAWMDNLKYLSTYSSGADNPFDISTDVIEAAGAMGPAGKHMIQEWVNGLSSEDPAIRARAEQSVNTFAEAVAASKIDFGPNLAEYTNVTNQAKAMGIEFSNVFAASLTPDDWTALNTSLSNMSDKFGPELGSRLSKKMFTALSNGTIDMEMFSSLTETFSTLGYRSSRNLMDAINAGVSMEQIQARLDRIEAPRVPIDFEVDRTGNASIGAQIRKLIGNKGLEIPAALTVETSIGDLRSALGDNFLMDIPAELTIAQAMTQFNSFKEYLLSQGIDVEMTANPNLAYVQVDSFLAATNQEQATVMIDALTYPGEGKLWQFVELADGTPIVAKIDAETGKATGKLQKLETDAQGNTKWVTVDARTEMAAAAIAEINAAASKPTESQHTVKTNVGTVKVSIDSLNGRDTTSTHTIKQVKVNSAFGNIFEAYAKGGVREDHRPQIAPAGAMRLWAEPETDGEAYIPFAKDRRKRAVGILDEVANRFGYQLAARHNNVIQYNNGGMYDAARVIRASASATQRGNRSGSKGSWEFHVHNPQHKDPLQDMWDKVQSYNPGFGFDE